MKKFKFRLAAVLRYRKYLEQNAQLELVKAKNAVIEKRNLIERLKQNRLKAILELKDREDKGVSVGRHRFYTNYITGTDAALEEEHKQLLVLEKEMRRHQEIVRKEQIKRKTLEKIEEKQKKEYNAEYIKFEQKSMDEMVVIRRKPKKEAA
ncbi:MAG: flagellar FliJ protein [Candidatus Magnetoglobus multicellularis str. Araruama]|uniref:Flagellar FliJ protein n=1 Tax=Candidatus Magnetoglobus multicellularis str. Araruama TaxID=890399 RepID=A0A1V1PHC5_9BACT|nr:MAG: flagellar FliJ protein [Candidatus Magnetoglobus multicellularis str. Araruama]